MTNCSKGRVIFLGVDGLDASLTEYWLDKGFLPHMSKLATGGTLCRLIPLRPNQHSASWASFLTGVNPAEHGHLALPRMDGDHKRVRLPELVIIPRRLGRAGIFPLLERGYFFSAFKKDIRPVMMGFPHTFPAPRIKGHLLTGCLPSNFKGLASPLLLTSEIGGKDELAGGQIIGVQVAENTVSLRLQGPNFTSAPLRIVIEPDKERAVVHSRRRSVEARLGKLSKPLQLAFVGWLRRPRRALLRFLLSSITPHLRIFIPGVLPHPMDFPYRLSQPRFYAARLIRILGDLPFIDPRLIAAAHSSGMVDMMGVSQILEQNMRLSSEAFLRALENNLLHPRLAGSRLLALNIRIIDALQHVVWGNLRKRSPKESSSQGKLLLVFYRLLDSLVGRILERIGEDDVLIVAGDSGQRRVSYLVSLNRYFLERGLLHLKEGVRIPQIGLHDFWDKVDWDRTRVYSLGGGSIYLNRNYKGYQQGRRAEENLAEAREALVRLKHGKNLVVKDITYGRAIFSGEFFEKTPHLMVDFAPGFASGYEEADRIPREVFSENQGGWSGEHLSLHPQALPSLLISNLPIKVADLTLLDLPPTIASFLGQDIPDWWEGRDLWGGEAGEI